MIKKSIREIHLDRDIEAGPRTLGGYEPIPAWEDYENSEEDEKEETKNISIKELRHFVRKILREPNA